MVPSVLLSIFLSFSFLFSNELEEPLTPDLNKPLGDVVSVRESVETFEELNDKNILLPTYIPIRATIEGGSVINRTLHIDYLNEKNNERVSIYFFDDDFYSENDKKAKKVPLKNGALGSIFKMSKDSHTVFLTFRTNGLTYVIGLTTFRKQDKIDELINIANSL